MKEKFSMFKYNLQGQMSSENASIIKKKSLFKKQKAPLKYFSFEINFGSVFIRRTKESFKVKTTKFLLGLEWLEIKPLINLKFQHKNMRIFNVSFLNISFIL